MDYNEILKLSRGVFNNYTVVEKPFDKYGINRSRIVFKNFNKRLNKDFPFAEITNFIIGTTFVDDVWDIHYFIGDNVFDFRLESGGEESVLEISLNWYLEAKEVERLRSEYYLKYQQIKRETLSEVRNHKLNKVL
jgi:hypothetical protein